MEWGSWTFIVSKEHFWEVLLSLLLIMERLIQLDWSSTLVRDSSSAKAIETLFQANGLPSLKAGTINAWNNVIDPLNAQIVFSDPNKVFKGCDILHDMLYVTDFSGGMVDVWNSSWAMVNSFTDPSLTAIGYAPYVFKAVGELALCYFC